MQGAGIGSGDKGGMSQDRVNWDTRNWDAVSPKMQSPGILILQHKTRGKLLALSSKSLRKNCLVFPTGYKHLPQGYEEELSTSCSLQCVFLRVCHLSDPSTRGKAAGGQQRLAANLPPSLHPPLYPSFLLFPALRCSWCCQVTALGT